MTEPQKFDPKIGAKKAARDAGVTLAVTTIGALGGVLAQPEVAAQISAAVTGLVPPPWGLMLGPVALSLAQFAGKYGVDWARRTQTAKPKGQSAVDEARKNYYRGRGRGRQ